MKEIVHQIRAYEENVADNKVIEKKTLVSITKKI